MLRNKLTSRRNTKAKSHTVQKKLKAVKRRPRRTIQRHFATPPLSVHEHHMDHHIDDIDHHSDNHETPLNNNVLGITDINILSKQQYQNKRPILTLAHFKTSITPEHQKAEEHLKDKFVPSSQYVRDGLFTHPGFDEELMKKIDVQHLEPENFGDKVALSLINLMRTGFDVVSGYKHPPHAEEKNVKYKMSYDQIMRRCVLLESVAACPGLVGAMCRHLKSIRVLKRDLGWMESLIAESHNERMHLIAFLHFYKPGFAMKSLILLAQATMMSSFFLAYLVAPRVVHRSVGYLEEEAVKTYSRILQEVENGWHDDWALQPAPEFAIAYWKMRPDATFYDMVGYIRADEATHRSVNHTFANLDQDNDINPFAIEYPEDSPLIKPSIFDLKSQIARPLGWKRHEIDVSNALHHTHPKYEEIAQFNTKNNNNDTNVLQSVDLLNGKSGVLNNKM